MLCADDICHVCELVQQVHYCECFSAKIMVDSIKPFQTDAHTNKRPVKVYRPLIKHIHTKMSVQIYTLFTDLFIGVSLHLFHRAVFKKRHQYGLGSHLIKIGFLLAPKHLCFRKQAFGIHR